MILINKEKLKAIADRLNAQCQILESGEYQFEVQEVREEHDDKRQYDYVYVRLNCGGTLTSDRFPITDSFLWKLRDLLLSVGVDIDSLDNLKELVGRTGKLSAQLQPDGKTFYKYQPKGKA